LRNIIQSGQKARWYAHGRIRGSIYEVRGSTRFFERQEVLCSDVAGAPRINGVYRQRLVAPLEISERRNVFAISLVDCKGVAGACMLSSVASEGTDGVWGGWTCVRLISADAAKVVLSRKQDRQCCVNTPTPRWGLVGAQLANMMPPRTLARAQRGPEGRGFLLSGIRHERPPLLRGGGISLREGRIPPIRENRGKSGGGGGGQGAKHIGRSCLFWILLRKRTPSQRSPDVLFRAGRILSFSNARTDELPL
jgi:hypothetical protein